MMVKKAITLLALVLLGNLCYAQVQAWGGGADENLISFGFSFQYIQQDYKIVRQDTWRTPIKDPETGSNLTSPLTRISSKPTPGFTVGFITRYRVAEHLELRTTPALVFADRELNYEFENKADDLNRQIQTTSIDMPLLLKLRSDRLKNFRAYLVAGVKYSLAVNKGKIDPNDEPLQQKILNRRGIGSYEFGLGCDIYFEYFKMSPEIKVANSFNSVLVGNAPLSQPLNKLFLHSLMFSLHFE
ncbi:type IX secretion/gliding motility protein PorT/SprT [Mucilaginibacter aquatilis]|uniref:Outer membrane beta-barrel protein n=1 Tax=Mucilaginibacter aquatilis TaxID=1517760 RepID=A0A6I4ID60_9SPHI|nr:outer membrane beta-barrel protein [Mucilaginibacter aquatilis]MVN93102.1 outer membrane beta-barrel protein [Mucilaginibacter aquatilis]